MFYNFVKANKEKETEKKENEEEANNRDNIEESKNNEDEKIEMDPGLWGRKYHEARVCNNKSSPSESKSKTESVFFDTVETEHDDIKDPKDFGEQKISDLENEGSFIYVPKCMLGKPLKDLDGEDDSVSQCLYSYETRVFFKFLKILC